MDIKYPFKPSWEINGEESKGTTYGIDLQSYTLPDTVPQYSEKLIHTIWECLYEKPEHRPTAFELKERVVAAFRPGGVPNVDVSIRNYGSFPKERAALSVRFI